jgi:hypothetical protein
MKAKNGLWTPWAMVICYKCHGPEFGGITLRTLSESQMELEDQVIAIKERNKVTFCDKCGCDIQVDSSVAEEHNFVRALRAAGLDADMEQTGGMNSACVLYKNHMGPLNENEFDPIYYVTYDWDGCGQYAISGSDEEQQWVEGEDFQTDTFDEMVEYIKTLTNVRKLEVK